MSEFVYLVYKNECYLLCIFCKRVFKICRARTKAKPLPFNIDVVWLSVSCFVYFPTFPPSPNKNFEKCVKSLPKIIEKSIFPLPIFPNLPYFPLSPLYLIVYLRGGRFASPSYSLCKRWCSKYFIYYFCISRTNMWYSFVGKLAKRLYFWLEK